MSVRSAFSLFLVPVLLVSLLDAAHGQSPADEARLDARLQEGRRLLDAGKFEQAQAAFRRVESEGGLSASALRDLLELLGIVGASLGEDDASFYFKKLLSIDSDAELRAGTSPKIVSVFEAARSVIRLTGGIALVADLDGPSVVVRVEEDPLALVHQVRVQIDGEEAATERGNAARFLLPARRDAGALLQGLDRFGNVVVQMHRRFASSLSAPVSDARAAPAHDSDPLWSRTWLWLGLSAASAGAGVYFGLRARELEDEVVELNRSSSQHDAKEVTSLVERQHSSSLAANVGFGLAVATGVTALYFGLRSEKRESSRNLDIQLGARSASVAATLRF